MVRRIALLVSLGVVAAGCSLLVDNDPFLGNGDASADAAVESGVDGGVDAGPDAPTVPVVHIEPADPRTLDDLTVVIDTESTDPLMAGAITYEYRWLRDTVDSGESGTTVDNALTARDEVWRVEVTPVTADMRRGNAGTDEVTIGNTPPVLLTVGLSDYRPIVGEELVALPGPVTDPDGDATTITYAWTVDGSPIAGATSSRLLIRDGVIAPGTSIRVEAHAADGDAVSASVGAGSAVVVADVTRWNQILPDRGSVIASRYDAAHHRVVMVVDVFTEAEQLWEHDLTSDTFVRLRPASGFREINLVNSGAAGPGRVFAVGRATPFQIEMLDLSARGEEDWTMLELDSATAPSGEAYGALYDAEGDKLFVVVEETTTDALYRFDLSVTPVVATRVIDTLTAPVRSAAWAINPTTREAYAFGGASASLSANDAIYRLDLDDPTSLVEITPRMPSAAFGVVATYDATSDRYIVGFGVDTTLSPHPSLYRFDVSAGTFETIDVSAGPAPGFLGWTAVAADGSLLVTGGRLQLFQNEDYELFEVDRDTWTTSGRHVIGRDLPPALEQAFAHVGSDGRFNVYGGRTWEDQVQDTLYQSSFALSPVFVSFAPVSVAPDTIAGAPGPRFGQGHGFHGEFYVFGGGSDTAARVTGDAFRLEGTGWVASTLASTSGPPPSARNGAVIFEGCGTMSVFGGRTSGGVTNEMWNLTCTARDTDCTWTSSTPGGGGPVAREFAAIGAGDVMYGGFGSTNLSDAWLLTGCPGTWTPLTVTTPIGPRSGHSMPQNLLFGGFDGTDNRAEAYRVNVAGGSSVSFEELVPATDGDGVPLGRSNAAVANPSGADRLLVYGGIAGTIPFLASRPRRLLADLWELRIR